MRMVYVNKGSLTKNVISQHLDLEFQSPELWEINSCSLSHPVYSVLLLQPKLINTPGHRKIWASDYSLKYRVLFDTKCCVIGPCKC